MRKQYIVRADTIDPFANVTSWVVGKKTIKRSWWHFWEYEVVRTFPTKAQALHYARWLNKGAPNMFLKAVGNPGIDIKSNVLSRLEEMKEQLK